VSRPAWGPFAEQVVERLSPVPGDDHLVHLIAAVTTGAKDETGTPLDQDPNTTGNQGKVWSCKIKR
jgi:hypothetical protein